MKKLEFFHYLGDSWKSLLFDYREFREGPREKEEILKAFHQAALPAFGYYFMLAVSALITTLGLIANSAATIIGAMIISPLMNPIITLSFGITAQNRKLIDRGCFMLFTGIPLVVLIAYFSSSLIGIRSIGSEVLSRAHPTYLDLGMALGSGIAAAFAYSRKSIANTLPGVAIAVALLPPLCVMGIGMHAGLLGKFMAANAGIDENMSIGALNLFLTNLWGILFSSVLIFSFQKYGHWKKVIFALSLSLIILIAVITPLGEGFYRMYIREVFYKELLAFRVQEKKFSEAEIRSIDIRFYDDQYRIQMTFFQNIDIINEADRGESQAKIDRLAERLSAKLKNPVLIEMNVIPIYHLSSDKEETSLKTSA